MNYFAVVVNSQLQQDYTTVEDEELTVTQTSDLLQTSTTELWITENTNTDSYTQTTGKPKINF